MAGKSYGELTVIPAPPKRVTIAGVTAKLPVHLWRPATGIVLFVLFSALFGQACSVMSRVHFNVCAEGK
jgi:hypothetical protein